MAKLNVGKKVVNTTHEGAPAKRINALQQLERSVLACMLWEDTFYEDGESVANRIVQSVAALSGEEVANVAVKARNQFKLRHVPLLLAVSLANGTSEQRRVVGELLPQIIQRPDELTELLAIYWKDGRVPLRAQIKKGLARAFTKFNAYQLAKYNQDGPIKLRDVMFLTHPNPESIPADEIRMRSEVENKIETFRKLAEGTLESPDTWEVNLSAGKDKKETFTRLLLEGKLGALALLRNLRNMEQAGVDSELIKHSILAMNTKRVLPFRFITAARYAPRYENELEQAMFKCLEGAEKLSGKTVLLVDNSGSMYGTKVSAKSELDRCDAAGALAILLREICEKVDVVAFSGNPTLVPARRGFALAEAIKATEHGGTYTEKAKQYADKLGYDRIIIITDEQSHQALSNPLSGTTGYVINVASYKNGIGYGKWNHLDGFSEAIVDYIQEYEKYFAHQDLVTNFKQLSNYIY